MSSLIKDGWISRLYTIFSLNYLSVGSIGFSAISIIST